MKNYLFAAALLLGLFCPLAANEVEISGEYEQVIACADTHHELTSYVIEPGPDKFSGTRHLLDIPPEMKKDLQTGMKIRVVGVKRKPAEKKMTKGQVRRDMVQFIVKGTGLPYETNDMASIITKIIKKEGNAKGGQDEPSHDHGELELKPVDDDDEIIDVIIPEHVVVTKIDLIK